MLLGGLLLGACAPQEKAFERMTVNSAWHDGEVGNPSEGCFARGVASGTDPAGAGAVPASVQVNGRNRSFISRVPASYEPGVQHDLVVAFHGRTNPNTQVRRYYELDEAMPEAVILYPSALPDGNAFRWSDAGDPPDRLRDYAFLEALIATVGDALCLDLERVFVVGHSLGASFANSVACQRGGLVRAVASVAGGLHGSSECVGGAAALLIHHPEDRLTPISEGLRARDALLSANGLSAPPVPASEPELMALGCERYGVDTPHPILWCAHSDSRGPGGRYYPHTWPDAAPLAMARFFRDLP